MREMPNNPEAEMHLLGCIFHDPRLMAQMSHALYPTDFASEKNNLVWAAMQSLSGEGKPIDVISVGTRLKNCDSFKSLFGGSDYLFALIENTSSSANAGYYAELIAKCSALRRLIGAMQKTLAEAFDPGADADALIAAAMERVAEIASGSARAGDEHIADIAADVLDGIRDRMQSGAPAGTPTGFDDLDEKTGGLRPGELVIVGARTGMGKTSFAMDIAIHAAAKMPVKFFSLEMARRQIAPRALSFFSQVSLKKTITASLSESELLNQYAVIPELRKLGLYMEFEAGLSIGEICAECHAFAAKHGKGLVVIDHLHYIKTGDRKSESRNIELGRITHALKELAKKLDIPVLLLSQLNRDIDRAAGKDKKPRLSDLRDSGNIEQDADMVWFIHRPGYYIRGADLSETFIIVAKNRSGPTGEIKLNFDTSTTKFGAAKDFAPAGDGYTLDLGG